MTVSKVKLTDLPAPLQTHILSMLLPTPSSPHSLEPSLECVTSLKQQLPSDLLSVSKTCRALSRAAIDALGTRAQLLNQFTAKPLWEWVAVFGKAVKAVSLYGSEIDERHIHGSLVCLELDILEKVCEHALKTFVALSLDDIQLQVLDVKTVPFHRFAYPEVLQQTFVNTLERSSSTLRELGLRITPICANAMSRVTLPNLQIVELQLSEIVGNDEIIVAERGQCADICRQMLRVLEGHADRAATKTTLHELRLLCFSEAPCTQVDKACSGLFQSVQVLKLRSIVYNGCNDDGLAMFIALFPNLRCLHWNGAAAAASFNHIHSKCPALEEMHLSPYLRYTSTADLLAAGDAPSKLNDLLASYQGKLRSLQIQARLSPEQLKLLGENNPALKRLAMEIDRGNVAALSSFLGTHCRQIKRLKLLFVPYSMEALGEEGWGEFTKGILSASEELTELSISCHYNRYPHETAYNATVQSILDIIEFFGKRVRKLCVAVPFEITDLKVQYEALCRIINACATHSENMEHLHLRIEYADGHARFEDEEEEANWSAKLVREIEKLEKLPHLHALDLGQQGVQAKKTLALNGFIYRSHDE